VGGARILDERESLAAAGRLQPAAQLAERGGRVRIAKAGKRCPHRLRIGRCIAALLAPFQQLQHWRLLRECGCKERLLDSRSVGDCGTAAQGLDQAIVQAAAVRFVTGGRK